MAKEKHGNSTAGAVYGLGFIGALIYFISVATGFWAGLWVFLRPSYGLPFWFTRH